MGIITCLIKRICQTKHLYIPLFCRTIGFVAENYSSQSSIGRRHLRKPNRRGRLRENQPTDLIASSHLPSKCHQLAQPYPAPSPPPSPRSKFSRTWEVRKS